MSYFTPNVRMGFTIIIFMIPILLAPLDIYRSVSRLKPPRILTTSNFISAWNDRSTIFSVLKMSDGPEYKYHKENRVSYAYKIEECKTMLLSLLSSIAPFLFLNGIFSAGVTTIVLSTISLVAFSLSNLVVTPLTSRNWNKKNIFNRARGIMSLGYIVMHSLIAVVLIVGLGDAIVLRVLSLFLALVDTITAVRLVLNAKNPFRWRNLDLFKEFRLIVFIRLILAYMTHLFMHNAANQLVLFIFVVIYFIFSWILLMVSVRSGGKIGYMKSFK